MFFRFQAYPQTFISQGTTELGGGLTFSSQVSSYESSSNSGSDYNIFSLQPYLGIMLPAGIELGFLPGITAVWGGGSSTIINLFFAPSVNINTKTNVYPFIELLLGYNSLGTNNRSGIGYGVDGGLKINIEGNSLLLIQLQYLHQNLDRKNSSSYSSTYNSSLVLKTFSFGIGFRVFIPGKTAAKKQ